MTGMEEIPRVARVKAEKGTGKVQRQKRIQLLERAGRDASCLTSARILSHVSRCVCAFCNMNVSVIEPGNV